jgi:hypothetical protein
MGENLHDGGFSNYFLDVMSKTQANFKGKLYYIKIKICALNDTISTVKR